MPDFSDADRKLINDYVNDRLAAGDKAMEISRDLHAHWAEMDRQAAEAAISAAPAVEPDPGPPPHETPVSGVFASGSSGPARSPLELATAPITPSAARDLISQGYSSSDVAALIQRVGFDKRGTVAGV